MFNYAKCQTGCLQRIPKQANIVYAERQKDVTEETEERSKQEQQTPMSGQWQYRSTSAKVVKTQDHKAYYFIW